MAGNKAGGAVRRLKRSDIAYDAWTVLQRLQHRLPEDEWQELSDSFDDLCVELQTRQIQKVGEFIDLLMRRCKR